VRACPQQISFSIRAHTGNSGAALVSIAKRVYQVALAAKLPFIDGLIDAETIRSQRVRYGRKARADRRSSSSKIEDRNQHLEAGQVDSSALGYSKSRNEAREKSLIHRCG